MYAVLSRIVSVAVLILAFYTSSEARPRNLDQALDSLDEALIRRPGVIERRRAGIDSLRRAPYVSARKRNRDLARAWSGLNSDSALYYYTEALAAPSSAGDSVSRPLLMIEYARQLGVVALYQEAISYLDSIDVALLSTYEKMSYRDVRSRVLLDAMSASASPGRKEVYRLATREQLDSLSVLVAPYPGAQRLTHAVALALDGDTLMASGELYQAIDTIAPGTVTFAIACDLLASCYRHRPEKRYDYLYFLALASRADALAGNGEAYSLELLGSEIFKEGDFERALNYITVAGMAMQEVGARKRVGHGTPPLSIMLQTMRQREHNRHVALVVVLSLFVVLAVAFVMAVVHFIRLSRRKERHLAYITHQCEAKDKYIGQLFELCAGYIDSMEDFNRLVSRKIKANQAKDLYETVESGRILKQQAERFYENFDRAVLQVFPDFPAEVNSLFAPDKKIEIPEGGALTPELRIAAFMRFGVTDSARIAKFLGLSLNTVYTYRNRMKSRATDRDDFDRLLLKIGRDA